MRMAWQRQRLRALERKWPNPPPQPTAPQELRAYAWRLLLADQGAVRLRGPYLCAMVERSANLEQRKAEYVAQVESTLRAAGIDPAIMLTAPTNGKKRNGK